MSLASEVRAPSRPAEDEADGAWVYVKLQRQGPLSSAAFRITAADLVDLVAGFFPLRPAIGFIGALIGLRSLLGLLKENPLTDVEVFDVTWGPVPEGELSRADGGFRSRAQDLSISPRT